MNEEPERDTSSEPARKAELMPSEAELRDERSQLWAFKQVIELERKRIDSTNRRTDVAL